MVTNARSLAQHLISLLPPSGLSPILIGLAGIPGAGKSTLTNALINSVSSLTGDPALCTLLPMDGYHLSREQLTRMPNSEEAFRRRGAPWTFDAERFVKDIEQLSKQGVLLAPSFDHNKGDPIEGDINITTDHRIIIVEGNYLYLNESPWNRIPPLLSECWSIDITIEMAMSRIVKRHMGMGLSAEEAQARVDSNDALNAMDIVKSIDHMVERGLTVRKVSTD